MHKKTRNIGDDIQTYAQSLFLPSIDYIVDRDYIDSFKSENNEPVALIMSAWWMWRKWNWPPAKCIIPYLTSMHFMNWGIDNWGTSIKDEILDGIGGEYLNSYGPVGCRDINTLKLFKKHKIKSYFSGCITLTLPKMKKRKNKKEYICVVDVPQNIIDKVKAICNQNNLELKVLTHWLDDNNQKLSWNKRKENVEKLLTIYQNSKCVITSRLHATLPCLAMEVPVAFVTDDINCDRFSPYKEYCSFMTNEEFINDKYDILNPPKNSKKYITVRNKLIKSINKFIDETKNINCELDLLVKTKYSDEEKILWQNKIMKNALDNWFMDNKNMLIKYNNTINYCRELEKMVNELKNSTSWKITKPIRNIKIILIKIYKKFFH